MAATPIFILGRHRSGTTWMSNILESLPEVYVPADAVHGGVHESGFFSHLVPHCGHGRTPEDLRSIQRHFEGSDFFALSGLAELPDILDRGPAGFFRDFMDAAASRHGARFWLEKTPAHTLHARFLLRAFPDAVFLAMIRDYRDVVASNVHAFGDPDSVRDWIWHSVVTVVYEKVITHNRIPVIRYSDLLADYPRTVRSILARLRVDRDALPQSRFDQNTSYQGARPRIRWWQSAAMMAGRWLIAPLPAGLVEAVVVRRQSRRSAALPPWFAARPGRAPRNPTPAARA